MKQAEWSTLSYRLCIAAHFGHHQIVGRSGTTEPRSRSSAMIESVGRALIGLLLVIAAVFLVLWVLGQFGIVLPAVIVKIVWVVVALIAVLIIVRAVRPFAGGWLP